MEEGLTNKSHLHGDSDSLYQALSLEWMSFCFSGGQEIKGSCLLHKQKITGKPGIGQLARAAP